MVYFQELLVTVLLVTVTDLYLFALQVTKLLVTVTDCMFNEAQLKQ